MREVFKKYNMRAGLEDQRSLTNFTYMLQMNIRDREYLPTVGYLL